MNGQPIVRRLFSTGALWARWDELAIADGWQFRGRLGQATQVVDVRTEEVQSLGRPDAVIRMLASRIRAADDALFTDGLSFRSLGELIS